MNSPLEIGHREGHRLIKPGENGYIIECLKHFKFIP